MRIKLKTTAAGPGGVTLPGGFLDLPPAQARDLIDSGQAEVNGEAVTIRETATEPREFETATAPRERETAATRPPGPAPAPPVPLGGGWYRFADGTKKQLSRSALEGLADAMGS